MSDVPSFLEDAAGTTYSNETFDSLPKVISIRMLHRECVASRDEAQCLSSKLRTLWSAQECAVLGDSIVMLLCTRLGMEERQLPNSLLQNMSRYRESIRSSDKFHLCSMSVVLK